MNIVDMGLKVLEIHSEYLTKFYTRYNDIPFSEFEVYKGKTTVLNKSETYMVDNIFINYYKDPSHKSSFVKVGIYNHFNFTTKISYYKDSNSFFTGDRTAPIIPSMDMNNNKNALISISGMCPQIVVGGEIIFLKDIMTKDEWFNKLMNYKLASYEVYYAITQLHPHIPHGALLKIRGYINE